MKTEWRWAEKAPDARHSHLGSPTTLCHCSSFSHPPSLHHATSMFWDLSIPG